MKTNEIYKITLFTVNLNQQTAIIQSLQQQLEDLGSQIQFEIIDVLAMPEKAIENDIFATPMLVRNFPPPLLKLLMNISSHQNMMLAIQNLTEESNILI